MHVEVRIDGDRARLATARLMCIFTPSLNDRPIEALAAALPWIDVVQVRVKNARAPRGAAPARELETWCRRVLELVARADGWRRPLVVVNDRVDVAAALRDEGLAGVHLGERDTPPALARELLGPEPLIGLSTHDLDAVAHGQDEPVDYLGFGPIHPTATKGYARGLGSESARVAAEASPKPLFPIGGIERANATELAPVGRAAVGAGILAQPDPAAAAQELRRLLEGEGEPFFATRSIASP